MYIPLSDDKHWKVQDSSKKCTENLKQIQSETKCSPRQNSVWGFFFGWWGKIFFGLNFVSDWICLRLHTAVVFYMQSFDLNSCCWIWKKKMNRSGIEISLADFYICNFIQSKFCIITCNWILQKLEYLSVCLVWSLCIMLLCVMLCISQCRHV